MKHYTEDELLQYALELIEDEAEITAITSHLSDCPECSRQLEKIKEDIGIISDVKPFRKDIPFNHQKRTLSIISRIMRYAAVLIIGVVIGYEISGYFNSEPAQVSPSYLTVSSPSPDESSFAVSDATAIPLDYYDQNLKSSK